MVLRSVHAQPAHPPASAAAGALSLDAAPLEAAPPGLRETAPATPSTPSTPAQLLLFVGEAIRPDATLTALLARDGLRCLCLPGPEQAVRAAALARFDAVLIDAALVDGRAARAIETLACTHRCPVVVLAEQADEVDEIVVLELGADLYLAHPLAPRRLRAHLGALLRRHALATAADGSSGRATGALPPLQAAGWTLEPARQRLTRGPRSVRLTQAQTALLRCLMAAGGAIVPAEELLAALAPHYKLHARSLRVHVHRLRQRLRDEGAGELQLEAVRCCGYALVTALERAA